MKIKRLASFGSTLVLSLSSLLLVTAPKVLAATITWNGNGSDSKFSTAANWVGGVAPSSGDALVFDNSATSTSPSNDLTGATFASITFQGSALSGFDISGNSFTLTGGITESSSGFDIIGAPMTITGPQTIVVGPTDTALVLAGVLNGSGNITKIGSGALEFAADNSTYTGAITVSSGNIVVGTPNALGTGSAPGATVNNGADFILSGCAGYDFNGNLSLTGNSSIIVGDFPNPKLGIQIGTCAGGTPTEAYGQPTNSEVVNLNGGITLGSDITFAAINATTNIKGSLSGAHAISMLPGYSGKLVINSSSNTSSTPNGTYSSPVFSKTLSDDQSANTVGIYGNNVITIDGKRGDTDIATGGVLKGTGTVGALTVASGGIVAPGHSPGCINTGNLTLNGTYQAEIGGTDPCTGYDQIKVTGTVNVTGATLDTSLYNGFKPAAGQSYIIINNDGADAVTGTFNNLAEGATFTINGYVLKVTYKGGDGNDVVLSAQSVPATPNTGFSLVATYPLQAFLAITAISGAIALIARRYNKLLMK